MKRIVSYCLYGSLFMYLIGALRNAEQVKTLYPGWTARFYVGKSVPADIVEALVERKAEVVLMDGPEDASAMLWRFLPMLDPSVEVMISRDCDSRLSTRETEAVAAWLKCGKAFHIMRDHPHHTIPILGGMWGVRKCELCAELGRLLQQFEADSSRGTDQIYLAHDVYPIIKNNACVHDSFFRYEWSASFFPSRRDGWAFVGEIFDEYDRHSKPHRDILESVCLHPLQRLKLCYNSLKGVGNSWTSREVL